MDAVERGQADAGLLIHEGQLTYSARGFEKVIDLGEWWKAETGLPLPLGGNAIKKSLGPELIERVSRLLRESIEFGLAHRNEAVRHSMAYARGMQTDLTDKFVGMYVNDYTIDYGDQGPQGRRIVAKTRATRRAFCRGLSSWNLSETSSIINHCAISLYDTDVTIFVQVIRRNGHDWPHSSRAFSESHVKSTLKERGVARL